METLDARYAAVVANDSALMHAFRLKLLAAPESFAPLFRTVVRSLMPNKRVKFARFACPTRKSEALLLAAYARRLA